MIFLLAKKERKEEKKREIKEKGKSSIIRRETLLLLDSILNSLICDAPCLKYYTYIIYIERSIFMYHDILQLSRCLCRVRYTIFKSRFSRKIMVHDWKQTERCSSFERKKGKKKKRNRSTCFFCATDTNRTYVIKRLKATLTNITTRKNFSQKIYIYIYAYIYFLSTSSNNNLVSTFESIPWSTVQT